LQNVILAGSSGHASVIADAIEKQGKYRIAGCVDSFRPAGMASFGYPILGPESLLPELEREYDLEGAVIGIGDNWQRARMAQKIRDLTRLKMPVVIHPSAQMARTATIEEGTVIFANAVVNSGAKIGQLCILNTASSLDHDCEMKAYASLAPGSTVGGRSVIGEFSAICLGARVIHGRRIGDHTVIGAGAVVLEDTPDLVVAYGVPSRVIRKRQAGDPYL
jgi:sugar O-acyltransferase (sialic acid O-acetyltransferase NeuD family)